jgi:hypothetical protein
MNKQIIAYLIIALVIGGVAGYYSGSKSARGPAAAGLGGQNGARNFNRLAGGLGQGGLTVGEIISADGQSVTLKLRDAGSKIIFFSSSTAITKTTPGSVSDLQPSQQITVTGSTNQDGSVTAQSIQIRPASSTMPFSR